MFSVLTNTVYLTETENVSSTSDMTRILFEALGVFTLIFIVFVGVIYLRNLMQISELDNKAKNSGGHIDTLIWDMNFNKNKIIPILEEAGIKISADLKKEPMLSLGMSPATQLYNFNMMQDTEIALKDLIKENPSVKSENLDTLLAKYDEIHAELAIAAAKYNNAAKNFNSYIKHFPANLIAQYRSKLSRSQFIYVDKRNIEKTTD
ncbi:MAG: LemA family protein [Eubacterium sp.]|nr:LemA family protein [Eubacterium sp.]